MNYEEEDDEQAQFQALQKKTLQAALCIQRGFRSVRDLCSLPPLHWQSVMHHRSYCDVRVFKFLKAAVCKAEQCVAIDMLHKISPGEAALLRDPAYNARLRFRCAASAPVPPPPLPLPSQQQPSALFGAFMRFS